MSYIYIYMYIYDISSLRVKLQSIVQGLIPPVMYVVFIISVVINFRYFSKTIMCNSEAVEWLSVQTGITR